MLLIQNLVVNAIVISFMSNRQKRGIVEIEVLRM